MSDINIVLENRDDIRVAVEEKDINVEVPAGKDGRSLRPRGEWSASAAYAYLDLVSYEGSSYVALKAVPAGTLPTDTSYWMLSAEKGEPGGAVWGNISGALSDQTDLQTALLDKAPVILSNASGSIASFTDGSPAPVTELSVAIEPVQAGTGDPSPINVRPISGHTSATVTRTGKNLLQVTATSGSNSALSWTVDSNGVIKVTMNAVVGYHNIIDIATFKAKAGVTYHLSGCPSGGSTATWRMYFRGSPDSEYDIGNGANFTRSEDTTLTLAIGVGSGTSASSYPEMTFRPMVEIASVADGEFEPYQGTQVTIDLDGTRYGGTVNVLTGELTVNYGFITLDGTQNWYSVISTTQGDRNRALYILGAKHGYSSDIVANYLRPSPTPLSSPRLWNGNINASGELVVGVPLSITTVEEWKTYLSNHPLQLVYELATPLTVQLTPSQMSTLKGQNNIWSDTGDVAVEYRADTKLFIERLTQPSEDDMTANANIASGKYFMVGNSLYLSTASIAQGDAIVPGTNCTPTSLAEALNAINA